MKKLWYDECAKTWYDAMPVGNGRVGAMVFGGTVYDKLHINEETLWSGSPYKRDVYDMQNIEKARELLKNRDYVSAQNFIKGTMLSNETAVYVPYGFVNIDILSYNGNVSEYYRELDIENAVATTRFNLDGNNIEKQVFVSLADDVIVYRIKSDKGVNLRITDGCELQHTLSVSDGVMKVKGRCPTKVVTIGNKKIEYDENKESVPFCSMLKVVANSDDIAVLGNATLRVTGRDVMLVFAIKTGFNGYDKMPISQGKEYENACKESLENACAFTYDELLNRHVKEYKKYYDRVSFELEGEDYDEPISERIKKFCDGREDNKLVALAFDYSRYLMISSNGIGTQPTNLQGIWNEDLFPAWRSNYTININTQMNYWATETIDLGELHKPLFDMLKDLSERGNAFGLRGWALFHNTDLWRDNRVETKNPQCGWWITSAPWLCRHIWEHYVHTRDEQFLRDYYDVMLGVAQFLQDFMIEEDGKLIVSPTTAPENEFVFDGQNCAVSHGSAMDSSICYDFFDKFIKINDILGKDNEQYKLILQKIKPVMLTSKGRIMEWNEDFEEVEPGHRHFSHLYGFYPADVLGKEYENAVRETLTYRLNNGSGYTGWSCAWTGCFFARLKDGQSVMEYIRKYFTLVRKNLLCTCGYPFQIDGNFGLLAMICETLVQSHNGVVETLPAIPKEWRHGEVKGFVTRLGEKIDFKW